MARLASCEPACLTAHALVQVTVMFAQLKLLAVEAFFETSTLDQTVGKNSGQEMA